MLNSDDTKHTIHSYEESTLIEKLLARRLQRKPLRIAFLDIDSTMTGNPKYTNQTRTLLENLGYAVSYVTTRTEEMLMSEDAFTKTRALGHFKRPKPQLGMKNGKHIYIPPERTAPIGILNPDIIAGSTGTQILLKQKTGGYLPDLSYEQGFHQESKTWRSYTMILINYLDPHHELVHLASVDNPDNYHNAKVDVFPPKFRIILRCRDLSAKLIFLKRLRKLSRDVLLDPILKKQLETIRFTDDSDPQIAEYNIYITPRKGYKAKAVEKVVDSICTTLHLERDQLELLLAGDSFPDLEMGLCGGRGTKATFLLVGGSRLTKALLSRDGFAGEELQAIKKGLRKRQHEGHYTFTFSQFLERKVIIGDVAYKGKQSVESILSFLTTTHSPLAKVTV